MHDTIVLHIEVVYINLSYLKGTSRIGLWLKIYCDVDLAGRSNDRRSTSRYCVFVGGNSVSWQSKKQEVVAPSTVKTEYRALALSLCEMVWLNVLLSELRVLRNRTRCFIVTTLWLSISQTIWFHLTTQSM